MKQIKIILLLLPLLLLTSNLSGQSNEGTEFWFGFMEHRDIDQNTKVAMITSKVNTTGVIEIPLQNWSENFTVNANDVTIITLPNIAEAKGSENIQDISVKLTTQDLVSVYIHQYFDHRSEATVVLPVESIGQNYYTMTYLGVRRQTTIYPSEFLIVATEDETNIIYQTSDNTVGGLSSGSNESIQLNQGQVYQVQAQNEDDDLTGSYITGDKPFAVFSGNRWTNVPSNCNARDNLLEQMYPVETWGRQFVTVPSLNLTYDIFRILASEDNTTIQVSGGAGNTFNLNAGEFVEYQSSDPSYISSNQPIMIAQFIIGNQCNGHPIGDPSMVVLNSIEQTRDTVTLFNSSLENITENYISIITNTADASTVTVDGQPLANITNLNTIGPNDQFTYTSFSVNEGAHTIISQGCGIIATAYGYGDAESYAYGGGASFNSINRNPIPEGGCLNDTISFDAQLPVNRYSFFWDLGDGTTTTEASFDHFYNGLGSYPVEVIITDECLGTVDTFNRELQITLRQLLENGLSEFTGCEGSSLQLGANDLADARYEWMGPNSYFSDSQFPLINNLTPQMSGTYSVVGIISGCATYPVDIEVNVSPNPSPQLGADTFFCPRFQEFTLTPGSYRTYRWQNNSTSPIFNVLENGNYSVTVTDENNCVGIDSIQVALVCPTNVYIPNIFSPNLDGINDRFEVYGQDIISLNMKIFNRWGALMFEAKDQSISWDGRYKGEFVETGVYAWMVEIEGYREDGTIYTEVLSGDLTVIK